MKRFLIALIISVFSVQQIVQANESFNYDVIEFQRDEEKASLINPEGEILRKMHQVILKKP